MAVFSSIVEGTRARIPVELPLPGAHVDLATGKWIGPTFKLDVSPLGEDDLGVVLAAARKAAIAAGVPNPSDDDPIYEREKMLQTLAITCIDCESPKDAPRPAFDGGVEQIRRSKMLGPEVVGYLYARQQIVQDEANPLQKGLTDDEFVRVVLSSAAGELDFFVNARPGTQWSCFRTMAALYRSSLEHKLSSSSASETSGETPT